MIIRKSKEAKLDANNMEINYFYRVTEQEFNKKSAYGIEVERQDIRNGSLINIERDSVNLISTDEERVNNLLNMLYKYKVSPLHLIDIIGEYVDKYVECF